VLLIEQWVPGAPTTFFLQLPGRSCARRIDDGDAVIVGSHRCDRRRPGVLHQAPAPV